jgi:hypothetical protein
VAVVGLEDAGRLWFRRCLAPDEIERLRLSRHESPGERVLDAGGSTRGDDDSDVVGRDVALLVVGKEPAREGHQHDREKGPHDRARDGV